MAVDTPTRRQTERVAPELAVAKLDVRDIALLAAYDILTEAEQHTYRVQYRRALASGQRIVDEHATAPDRPLPEIARLFFSFTWVFPNLGLAGPFFAGDTVPLKDAVLLAAREAVVSGVPVRHAFHARLWDHVCDPDRRAGAARFYVRHKPLHSFPPSAKRAAIERYCGRIDALMATAECMPALLATWAIERNPDRLRDLSRNDVKDKHGLFEQRHMAPFLGITPNTLTQSLRRLRLRFGEEMRLLWQIEKTDDYDGEQER